MRKQIIMTTLTIATFATWIAGCSKKKEQPTEPDSVKVVATTFAAFDWLQNLTRDTNIDVQYLNKDGVNYHQYEP